MIKESSVHFKGGVQNQDKNQQNWLNFSEAELESLKWNFKKSLLLYLAFIWHGVYTNYVLDD